MTDKELKDLLTHLAIESNLCIMSGYTRKVPYVLDLASQLMEEVSDRLDNRIPSP